MLNHMSARTGGRIALVVASASAAGFITTVAGGTGGPAPATKVALDFPCGVAFAAGHLYVGDGFAQQVSPQTGVLTTPAPAHRAFNPGKPAPEHPALRMLPRDHEQEE